MNEADDRLVAMAMALALLGGAALAVGSVVEAPSAVAGFGATTFLVGVVLAGMFGFRSARRSGDGVGPSLWRGVRTLFAWLLALLP